jgi:hypothetical protein
MVLIPTAALRPLREAVALRGRIADADGARTRAVSSAPASQNKKCKK